VRVSSNAFQNNELIPIKYTCDGKRISPNLHFSDIPEHTQSLVLIMDDPDAPSGNFVHWVVFNLPPETSDFTDSQIPDGIVGKNSLNQNNYCPPCPPSGQHHYFFKLYALDAMINLDQNATRQDVTHTMQKHVVAQAELIGLYR